MPEVTSGRAEMSFLCSVVLILETMSCVGVGVWVTMLEDLSRQSAEEDFSRVIDSMEGWTLRDVHADFWLPLKASQESSSVSDAGNGKLKEL